MSGNFDIDQVTNSGMLGNDLYDSLFGNMGFDKPNDSGGDNPQQWNDNSWWDFANGGGIRQDALDSYKGYSFNWNPTGGESGDLQAYNPSGTLANTFRQNNPSGFSRAMDTIAPMVFTALSGGMLAPAFGGGMLGGALGYGTANGVMAGMQGGNASQIGKASLGGAVSGGLGGMSPSNSFSSMAGIDNPMLGKMFNSGVGSTIGSVATGRSLKDSLTSGLTSAGTAGLNSLGRTMSNSFGDLFKQFSAPEEDSFDSLQGSGGDMSAQTDVTPSSYEEASPNFRYAGDNSQVSMPGTKTIQSGGNPNEGSAIPAFMSDMGSSVGNFLGANGGDLASMLYGFYNNRKQQKALQGQQEGLAGLYGQNSPYAQQLRAKLDAQGAASGRRINTGGREVQLQAMLADRAAQMAPNMYQLQQAQGKARSSGMNDILSFGRKTGLFDAAGRGLQGMFGPPTQNIPYNFGNVSGSDMFGYKGSGGF